MTWDSREYTALEWNNIQSEFKRIDGNYICYEYTHSYHKWYFNNCLHCAF